MKFLGEAILSLCPEAEFVVFNNDLSSIDWIKIPEGQKTPTIKQIQEKIKELELEEPMKLLRKHRDELIAETDWWVLPDRIPTQEQLNYRQALRDLPSTAIPVLDSTNPIGISNVSWPIKP